MAGSSLRNLEAALCNKSTLSRLHSDGGSRNASHVLSAANESSHDASTQRRKMSSFDTALIEINESFTGIKLQEKHFKNNPLAIRKVLSKSPFNNYSACRKSKVATKLKGSYNFIKTWMTKNGSQCLSHYVDFNKKSTPLMTLVEYKCKSTNGVCTPLCPTKEELNAAKNTSKAIEKVKNAPPPPPAPLLSFGKLKKVFFRGRNHNEAFIFPPAKAKKTPLAHIHKQMLMMGCRLWIPRRGSDELLGTGKLKIEDKKNESDHKAQSNLPDVNVFPPKCGPKEKADSVNDASGKPSNENAPCLNGSEVPKNDPGAKQGGKDKKEPCINGLPGTKDSSQQGAKSGKDEKQLCVDGLPGTKDSSQPGAKQQSGKDEKQPCVNGLPGTKDSSQTGAKQQSTPDKKQPCENGLPGKKDSSKPGAKSGKDEKQPCVDGLPGTKESSQPGAKQQSGKDEKQPCTNGWQGGKDSFQPGTKQQSGKDEKQPCENSLPSIKDSSQPGAKQQSGKDEKQPCADGSPGTKDSSQPGAKQQSTPDKKQPCENGLPGIKDSSQQGEKSGKDEKQPCLDGLPGTKDSSQPGAKQQSGKDEKQPCVNGLPGTKDSSQTGAKQQSTPDKKQPCENGLPGKKDSSKPGAKSGKDEKQPCVDGLPGTKDSSQPGAKQQSGKDEKQPCANGEPGTKVSSQPGAKSGKDEKQPCGDGLPGTKYSSQPGAKQSGKDEKQPCVLPDIKDSSQSGAKQHSWKDEKQPCTSGVTGSTGSNQPGTTDSKTPWAKGADGNKIPCKDSKEEKLKNLPEVNIFPPPCKKEAKLETPSKEKKEDYGKEPWNRTSKKSTLPSKSQKDCKVDSIENEISNDGTEKLDKQLDSKPCKNIPNTSKLPSNAKNENPLKRVKSDKSLKGGLNPCSDSKDSIKAPTRERSKTKVSDNTSTYKKSNKCESVDYTHSSTQQVLKARSKSKTTTVKVETTLETNKETKKTTSELTQAPKTCQNDGYNMAMLGAKPQDQSAEPSSKMTEKDAPECTSSKTKTATFIIEVHSDGKNRKDESCEATSKKFSSKPDVKKSLKKPKQKANDDAGIDDNGDDACSKSVKKFKDSLCGANRKKKTWECQQARNRDFNKECNKENDPNTHFKAFSPSNDQTLSKTTLGRIIPQELPRKSSDDLPDLNLFPPTRVINDGKIGASIADEPSFSPIIESPYLQPELKLTAKTLTDLLNINKFRPTHEICKQNFMKAESLCDKKGIGKNSILDSPGGFTRLFSVESSDIENGNKGEPRTLKNERKKEDCDEDKYTHDLSKIVNGDGNEIEDDNSEILEDLPAKAISKRKKSKGKKRPSSAKSNKEERCEPVKDDFLKCKPQKSCKSGGRRKAAPAHDDECCEVPDGVNDLKCKSQNQRAAAACRSRRDDECETPEPEVCNQTCKPDKKKEEDECEPLETDLQNLKCMAQNLREAASRKAAAIEDSCETPEVEVCEPTCKPQRSKSEEKRRMEIEEECEEEIQEIKPKKQKKEKKSKERKPPKERKKSKGLIAATKEFLEECDEDEVESKPKEKKSKRKEKREKDEDSDDEETVSKTKDEKDGESDDGFVCRIELKLVETEDGSEQSSKKKSKRHLFDVGGTKRSVLEKKKKRSKSPPSKPKVVFDPMTDDPTNCEELAEANKRLTNICKSTAPGLKDYCKKKKAKETKDKKEQKKKLKEKKAKEKKAMKERKRKEKKKGKKGKDVQSADSKDGLKLECKTKFIPKCEEPVNDDIICTKDCAEIEGEHAERLKKVLDEVDKAKCIEDRSKKIKYRGDCIKPEEEKCPKKKMHMDCKRGGETKKQDDCDPPKKPECDPGCKKC